PRVTLVHLESREEAQRVAVEDGRAVRVRQEVKALQHRDQIVADLAGLRVEGRCAATRYLRAEEHAGRAALLDRRTQEVRVVSTGVEQQVLREVVLRRPLDGRRRCCRVAESDSAAALDAAGQTAVAQEAVQRAAAVTDDD